MSNNGVGSDAALLNQKIELGGHAFFYAEMRRLDEQAIDTDVQDAGNIIPAVAAPADPDVF